MPSKLGSGLRRAVLWDFRRGSWQYDVIVAAILAFIFVAPRYVNFGDQPRPPAVQQIESLSDEQGTMLFWVDPSVIDGTPKDEVAGKLSSLLRQRAGRALQVVEMRPAADEEGEIRAYLVYARP
jgi:hypothetical protein